MRAALPHLTMRADFVGECARFYDLPEAINEGQFLIPRLTRDQRRAAITGPIAVADGAITGLTFILAEKCARLNGGRAGSLAPRPCCLLMAPVLNLSLRSVAGPGEESIYSTRGAAQ